jgi:uncharacterized GH25 family protein
MKRRYLLSLFLVCTVTASLAAHDLFFRMSNFFVAPGSSTRMLVLNGTFSSSENSVTRDRLLDLSVVSPAGRTRVDTALWSARGDTSVFFLRAGAAGTYVVGASLSPREITLEAKEFNTYLADDGIPDILEARKRNGELGKPATERYAKHIKALVQVGSQRTGDFAAVLGYPAELVPLDNPYTLRARSTLRVRAMVDGKAVPNQLVVWGGRFRNEVRFAQRSVRTDADGVARISLRNAGQYYVKFIHMTPYQGPDKLDYESKWATLTFEVR